MCNKIFSTYVTHNEQHNVKASIFAVGLFQGSSIMKVWLVPRSCTLFNLKCLTTRKIRIGKHLTTKKKAEIRPLYKGSMSDLQISRRSNRSNIALYNLLKTFSTIDTRPHRGLKHKLTPSLKRAMIIKAAEVSYSSHDLYSTYSAPISVRFMQHILRKS